MPTSRLLSTAIAVAALATTAFAADPKIRVVVVDGQNNHDWKSTTPIILKQFAASDRFTVDVATSPQKPKKGESADDYKAAMDKFHPDLTKYDVLVSNYNGDSWGKAFNDDLDARLKAGKIGLVIVHAANNAFGGWKEYNQMIGMGWRGPKDGRRLKYDGEGKEIIVPAGEDQGSGHRYTGPFTITVRDPEHPITKGMPKEWLHALDELYDNMRGPIQNVKILATALSDAAKKGTGAHEPMIWTVTYGEGRVFHTPMGHDANAMRCIGFGATLLRGTEWAATGKVTIPLPVDFPTAEKNTQIPAK
ncbi:ThuA domain-containing protein [Fimbriiglobus ruber]|uniref:ThuA-like domain-containing protein n=1 Tax=Fimbriiglobus ruber TaxID=1908690 RepID=A0A225E5S5_9BACT|nr:ThuA domain-containing protein [Fimbriiglobus ruber]OWK47114.1 hypothetical protein FRUB_00813 [Fimbriiglobus ruber]